MTAATEPKVLQRWVSVCAYQDLVPERGVAALVGGVQIALFRLADGTLRAVDNYDPCSGACVLSRGIVGSTGEIPTVASPMHKQRFDLDTGRCLDDPTYSVVCHPIRVVGTHVQIELG